MNDTPVPQVAPDAAAFGVELEPDPKDQQIAELQIRVETLQDKAMEERFIWIVACVILFNANIFSDFENWSSSIVIGIFELIALVIVADKCKVNTVVPLIDKLTGVFDRFSKTR